MLWWFTTEAYQVIGFCLQLFTEVDVDILETVRFSEQTMSLNKYPSIFSRQKKEYIPQFSKLPALRKRFQG